MAAPAKSFKSYFALSLALATAGEWAWCDTFPVEMTGNVVIFALESPLTQLRNRLHQLCPVLTPGMLPHTLTFFSGMHCLPSFKNGLQTAIMQVIDHYHPRLIIIDPLSYLYRLGRQDDLASATLDLLWPLAEMAAQAQIALVAAEHLRKRSKEDISIVDQLAGSHIKAAIVHALLMMHRDGEDIVVETTMRDAAPQELALTLTFHEAEHRVQWGYKGANTVLAASRLASVKLQVLRMLEGKGHPMSMTDLLVACGLPQADHVKANIRQILHRAETDGQIASSRRGEYYRIGQK